MFDDLRSAHFPVSTAVVLVALLWLRDHLKLENSECDEWTEAIDNELARKPSLKNVDNLRVQSV